MIPVAGCYEIEIQPCACLSASNILLGAGPSGGLTFLIKDGTYEINLCFLRIRGRCPRELYRGSAFEGADSGGTRHPFDLRRWETGLMGALADAMQIQMP